MPAQYAGTARTIPGAEVRLSIRDLLIGQRYQLFAATAHLNGDVSKRRAVKFQPGGLAVIGTADILDFLCGPLLELFHEVGGGRDHGNILALNCFFAAWHNF